MLTQTTEYALRALACLAEAPGEWREVAQVSRSLDIPSNYLSKILGQLARLGVLESRKGRGGGFRIKADPKDVTLAEVIGPLEGVGYPRVCVLGLDVCSDENPCPLHDQWKRIVAIQEEMLTETTLADLAAARSAGGRKKRAKRK